MLSGVSLGPDTSGCGRHRSWQDKGFSCSGKNCCCLQSRHGIPRGEGKLKKKKKKKKYLDNSFSK